MYRKKRVLVTGANGFIGSNLVSALRKEDDYEVFRGLRSVDGSHEGNDVRTDLLDITSLLKIRETHSFDAIIHLAAKVDFSAGNYADVYAENIISTGALGLLARQMDAHFIFGSTALVHGETCAKISSDSPIKIDGDYMRSKYHAEQILADVIPNSCILRIGGVFGKNGPRHLGLNRAISGALGGDVPVIYGSGESLRNYIFVDDLSQQIVASLKMEAEGTFLVAGSEVLSIKQMYTAVCERFLGDVYPEYRDADGKGFDQLIVGTNRFGEGRSFVDALKFIGQDIK